MACGCLSVEIEEEVTCGELLDELADVEGAGLDWSGAERGAWHLVERWNGCGKQSVFSASQPPFLSTRRAQAGRRRACCGGRYAVERWWEGVAQI